MWRRWGRRVGIHAAVVALIVLAVFWATAPHVVRAEDADRIRPGVQRWDVEQLFGRPPDKLEAYSPVASGRVLGNSPPPERLVWVATWTSPEGLVDVFLVNGRVDRVLASDAKGPWGARVACRLGLDRRLGLWP